MTAPYSHERKIEILTYARDHGVVNAARHFNVPDETITRWNKKLQIYTMQITEYPIEKRHTVLQYAAQHGIKPAAKHFGVSTGIIDRWNKELKIYKPLQRSFTHENKMEILCYARDYGTVAASDKYDISISLIIKWNKRLHVYKMRQTYTEQDKIQILTFARDNGVTAAEQKFDVPCGTMVRWNKKYNIYSPQQVPNYTEFSEQEQIKILKHAKRVYDELPTRGRSANLAFVSVAKKYNATQNQLRKWNLRYRIVPLRIYKGRQTSNKEIEAAQAALTNARGRVARASRQSGISEDKIKKMKTDKQIAFERGTAKLTTNPPVGRRKAGAIATIIQMLMRNKKQGKE